VVILKYGALLEAAFAEPGGERCAPGSTMPEPALFGAGVSGRRGLAQAPQ
jgi:hypothetical protein